MLDILGGSDIGSILKAVELAIQEALDDIDFVPLSIERPEDPVTSVDRLIDKRLRASLPQIVACPYLSEESSPETAATTGPVWVVDPIDGTHNLVVGAPEYGISVALVDATTKAALVAVCAMPATSMSYAAAKGLGSFVNGRRMGIADPAHQRLLVATGFPIEAYDDIDRALLLVGGLMRHGYVLRQSGSAVHDICGVAGGRLLGFIEEGIKLWDFVAADLIATEAGAVSYRAPARQSHGRLQSFDYAVARSSTLETLVSLFREHHG